MPRPRGWPDYSDFDEIEVRSIVAGRMAGKHFRPPEAAEAIRRLATAGLSDGQIAHRIGYHIRSVTRIRHDRGISSAHPVGTNRHTRKIDAPTAHWRAA